MMLMLAKVAVRSATILPVISLGSAEKTWKQGGRMCILETNPKPDLKRPDGSVTSLVCTELDAHGMDYEDLILSLLADRLDLLMRRRRGAAQQLIELAN